MSPSFQSNKEPLKPLFDDFPSKAGPGKGIGSFVLSTKANLLRGITMKEKMAGADLDRRAIQ